MYENCKRSLANFLTLSLQNQEEVRPKSQRYLNMTTKPWLTLTIRRKVWACFGANGFMTNHVVLRIGALTEGRLSVRAMMTPYDVGTIRCVALHALLSDLVVWSLNSSTLNSSDPFKSFKPFNRIHHDCQTVRLTSVTTKLTSLNRELRDAGWQFCERSGVPIQTCTLTSQWVLAHSLSSNFFQHYHRLAIWNILWIFFLVKVIFWHACLIPRGKLRRWWLPYTCWPLARITATQAVTCSHPKIVERAASGNAAGRCVLWAPHDDSWCPIFTWYLVYVEISIRYKLGGSYHTTRLSWTTLLINSSSVTLDMVSGLS